jgi:hypothetical protein
MEGSQRRLEDERLDEFKMEDEKQQRLKGKIWRLNVGSWRLRVKR